MDRTTRIEKNTKHYSPGYLSFHRAPHKSSAPTELECLSKLTFFACVAIARQQSSPPPHSTVIINPHLLNYLGYFGGGF